MFMYHGFYGFYSFWWPVAAVIAIIPFWRLCTRVGHSPWLSLLLLIPIANLIFVYYLAFSEWPAQRGGIGPGGTSAGSGFGSGPGAGVGPGSGFGPGSTPG